MSAKSIRVILVDPDPVSLVASANVLREAGIEVVAQAESGEEAVRLAPAAQPTVAVIDVGIGGMGAATAVRRLRDVIGHRLDIVAQASFSGVERIGEMVSSGAAAFVVKGKFGDLVAAVRAVAVGSGLLSSEVSRPLLEEVQRQYEAEQKKRKELEKTVARLEAVSITDWLTGLKNHGYFWQRLGEELQRARRYDRPLAVIMADLDDFKNVNDEYGHAVGDEVLRAAGEAMAASVRESDIACRVGGEEFAIIVPETSAVGALQAAERVREAVMEANVPPVERVTISLGCGGISLPCNGRPRTGRSGGPSSLRCQTRREELFPDRRGTDQAICHRSRHPRPGGSGVPQRPRITGSRVRSAC